LILFVGAGFGSGTLRAGLLVAVEDPSGPGVELFCGVTPVKVASDSVAAGPVGCLIRAGVREWVKVRARACGERLGE
jgi:hypothetical protein